MFHSDNSRIGRFYDYAYWLYPLVDVFCAQGRRRLIERINCEPAGRLLEVGVGPGRHLGSYRGHHVTAIDCSATMVASSRRHAPGADIRQMDGERLEFPAACFDYVVLAHVLSVTGNPQRMLAEAHRVLRPGGRLFVLNHETPAHAWRHVEALVAPVAAVLRFRSQFRVDAIAGVDRFHRCRLPITGACGLMAAYSLQK